MHTRTACEDYPHEINRRRHLWRLWLSSSLIARPRAPYFEIERGVRVAGMTERLRVDYVEGGGRTFSLNDFIRFI